MSPSQQPINMFFPPSSLVSYNKLCLGVLILKQSFPTSSKLRMYHDSYSGTFTVHNYVNMKWRLKPEHAYKHISLESSTFPTVTIINLLRSIYAFLFACFAFFYFSFLPERLFLLFGQESCAHVHWTVLAKHTLWIEHMFLM